MNEAGKGLFNSQQDGEETPFEEQKGRLGKKGSTEFGKSSSFYDRANDPIESQIYRELA